MRLRYTVMQMLWVSVIAMPGQSMPLELKLAASQIPNPNGTTDVDLLLHSVIKPGFPSTRQLPKTLNFDCTIFVGNLVDGPALPNEVQPRPPLGPTIWKGRAMFTVVNDEHSAN